MVTVNCTFLASPLGETYCVTNRKRILQPRQTASGKFPKHDALSTRTSQPCGKPCGQLRATQVSKGKSQLEIVQNFLGMRYQTQVALWKNGWVGSIRMQSSYTCTQIVVHRISECFTRYIVVLVLQATINTTSDDEFHQIRNVLSRKLWL